MVAQGSAEVVDSATRIARVCAASVTMRGTRLVVQSLCGLGVGGSWFIVGRID
jgi:hypothetical protein